MPVGPAVKVHLSVTEAVDLVSYVISKNIHRRSRVWRAQLIMTRGRDA